MTTAQKMRIIEQDSHVLEEIKACSGHPVAIDTETTGLLWYRDYVIGVGFYCEDTEFLAYVPILSDRDFYAVQEAIGMWDKNTRVIMHNSKFDMHMMAINPQSVPWDIIDTAELVHLYDSRLRKSLDSAERYFLGTSSKRKHLTEAPVRKKVWLWPLEVQTDYCTNDCTVTYQLAQKLIPKVQDLGLWNIAKKDMKYLGIIWNAERHGIYLDEEYVDKAVPLQEETLHGLEQIMYDSIGHEFNWRSTKQLSHALYEELGIAKPKNPFANADGVDNSRFADSGLYKSTCTSTFLLTEKTHHPLGTLVGALRESYRMMVTLKKYKELMDENHFVHGSFNLTGTRTGRLSCRQPNMQNVPSAVRGRFTQSVYSGSTIRTEEYNLRRGFLARPGKVLLSVDWKQMEMRMFGILAKDPLMLSFLAAGKDVHGEVAQRVWGVVDKTHREWSKTIGFGLIYGMTIGSLMHKLNQTASQAAKIRDQYLAEFPRIMPYMNEIIQECMTFGYVRYWDGRIWREDNPKDMFKGANAAIQGGCAEVLSIAAIRADEWCHKQGSEHNIVSFIHDELMLEVPKEDVKRSATELMEIMEIKDIFPVPFYNDAKAGPSYGDQSKVFDAQPSVTTEPFTVEKDKILDLEFVEQEEEPEQFEEEETEEEY